MAFGSEHVGPEPFVQPGPFTFPAALSQPPAYHAQETPLVVSSSPIVVAVCSGSLSPKVPDGCWLGCIVFTAQLPHTRAGVGHEPSGFGATVRSLSLRPVEGCIG